MKKLLALMIVLATVLSVVPVTVFAADANSAKVEGFSLSVNDGDIDLNFYLTLTDEVIADETAKVKFTTARGEVQEIPVKNGIKTVADTSNFYKFTSKISSVEMAENVKMELISGGNAIALNGGATYYEYSVKAYAEQLLNDATYGKLVKAMLNYGAYAQKYFAAKNETPLGTLANANCAYTTELDAVAADISAVTVAGTVQAGAKASLILDSDTSIVVYDKDGNKIGEKKGINSLNLDTAYEIDCGTSGKVTVSVLAVGEAVLAKSANADYKNLIKALKLYSDVSLEFAPFVYADYDLDDIETQINQVDVGSSSKLADKLWIAAKKNTSFVSVAAKDGEEAYLEWKHSENNKTIIEGNTTVQSATDSYFSLQTEQFCNGYSYANMADKFNECVSITMTLSHDGTNKVLPASFSLYSDQNKDINVTTNKTGKLKIFSLATNGKVSLVGGEVIATLEQGEKTTIRVTVDYKNGTITAYDEVGSIIATAVLPHPSNVKEGTTLSEFRENSEKYLVYGQVSAGNAGRALRIYDIRIESGNAFGG